MTYLVVGALIGFIIATIVAPAVDTAMRRRRELARCGGRVVPVAPLPRPVHFTRDPSPRRPEADRDGYYLRRVADGMEQT